MAQGPLGPTTRTGNLPADAPLDRAGELDRGDRQVGGLDDRPETHPGLPGGAVERPKDVGLGEDLGVVDDEVADPVGLQPDDEQLPVPRAAARLRPGLAEGLEGCRDRLPE